MAWYQRTYFNLNIGYLIKSNLRIIIMFFLFFIFFDLIFVTELSYCTNFTNKSFNKILINNNYIYFYGDLKKIAILNILNNISFLNTDQINFNICRFRSQKNDIFHYTNPLFHPFLNIMHNDNQFNNVFVCLQLSSNNISNVNNFNLLSETGIIKEKPQFISNSFYMFNECDFIKHYYYVDESLKYIYNNKIKIEKQIDFVINSYKK